MAVDIIARGMAGRATGDLSKKADLVNGKVPASQLPSYVDDVIEGYYYNNNFYEDEKYTKLITGEAGKIYVDLITSYTYRWSGSTYIAIGHELLAKDVKYTGNAMVATTVGGLKAGFVLYGHSVENIIDRLVGAYTSPTFTGSSMNITYNTINKRTETNTDYMIGDTVVLKSVVIKLNKGTDYKGKLNGVIKAGDNIIYTLSSEDITSIESQTSTTMNLDNIEYTFPTTQTTASITFSAVINYNKQSYDVNENIVVNEVSFPTGISTITAKDEEIYDKLYFGALPTEAVLNGLKPDGTVTYDNGNGNSSIKFGKQSTLGKVFVTTTEENTQAVFISDQLLTDISFLGFSDIGNWKRSEQTMSYTRTNGTIYSKTYYVYSQIIAVDTFTYELE